MVMKRKITKNIRTTKKKNYNKTKKKTKKSNKKQHGGGEADYWRMKIPSGTSPAGNFGALVDDIWAVVGSSINTMVDTVEFIKNVTTFKSDMGSEFNSGQSPGA
jgi:hypothetical protein